MTESKINIYTVMVQIVITYEATHADNTITKQMNQSAE